MQFYRKPIKTTSNDLLRLVGDVDNDGLRTGLWHAYRKDGSLYWEKAFDQGRLEGINRYYHPDKSIAIDSTFQGGFESDIQMYVPKGARKTDIPGFEQRVPGLVRLVNISDGRYGYVNIEFYGAKDARITSAGAPFSRTI